MGAALGGEPFRQRQQFFRRRLEGPHLTLDRAGLRAPYALRDRVPRFREGTLLCTSRPAQCRYRTSICPPAALRHPAWDIVKRTLGTALPGRCRPMAHSGVLWRPRSNCQTGSSAPSMSRPLLPIALRENHHRLPPSFTPRGSATPVEL
jgi:hypothetical protein